MTLALCCVWSIGFVFVQFFSTSIGMLCAGEILGGLAYGFYVVIAPTYASEICPLALRGVLTASVNLAFVIGQFIAHDSIPQLGSLNYGHPTKLNALDLASPPTPLSGKQRTSTGRQSEDDPTHTYRRSSNDRSMMIVRSSP